MKAESWWAQKNVQVSASDRRADLERDAGSELEQKSTECTMLNQQMHKTHLEYAEVVRVYHMDMDEVRTGMAKLNAEFFEEQEKHSKEKDVLLSQ